MKKSDLFQLLHNLREVAHYPGAKFAYIVAKNIKLLTDECTLIEKSNVLSDEFKEYESKRSALASSFADKNEDGSPKSENNKYVLSAEAHKEFEKELAKINIEYKEPLEAYEKHLNEFTALLNEESDVVLFKLKEESLPANITGAQVLSIINIIE